ncbi:hypothetical protein BGZ83_008577 [Gryganskiella cystojenkinii]|nr:hypothetical protein BGZ83_008577 [Gryganskiella cystojenkinii]
MAKFSYLSRPRRPTICGVPLTNELLLRVILLTATVAALIAALVPKVTSILKQVRVVSVTMTDDSRIPVPGTLVCGGLLDAVQVQVVNRGVASANGKANDTVRDIPKSMYTVQNASALPLRANGDWPTTGKCVLLQPKGLLLYAKNTEGEVDDDCIDSVVIVALSNTNFTGQNDIGLSIAIWDGNLAPGDQQPIWTGIPSINTLTFVYSEHIPLNTTIQTHFTMQKPSYTWVDLAGAIGGMASIALAIWIFLFGNGKYKSWGVVQRFILQTSPNAKRFRSGGQPDEPPKKPLEAAKVFIQKQIARMDTSAENDDNLDDVPLQTNLGPRDRRSTTRYSGAFDVNAVATGAASLSRGGRVVSFSERDGGSGGDPAAAESRMSRYSLDTQYAPNFYFSDQGAPGSRSLQPLQPLDASYDDPEEQVDELIRLIDLRMDERMWSLERTLSRYYLDGFRLRNYSAKSYRQSLSSTATVDHKNEGDANNAASAAAYHEVRAEMMRDQPSPTTPEFYPENTQFIPQVPRGSIPGPFSSSSNVAAATSSNIPQLSPRPQLRDFDYVVEDIQHEPSQRARAQPVATSSGSDNSISESTSSGAPFLNPGFPERKDMRGTIRRAVERLQQEWPQTHYPSSSAYVPKTQYGDNNMQRPMAQQPPRSQQGGTRSGSPPSPVHRVPPYY